MNIPMVQAVTHFYVPASRRHYRPGDKVAATHPDVRGRQNLFVPVGVDAPVEQATAAPGEKRAAVGHPCDVCDFVAKSAPGLGAHQRSHKGD